MENNDDVTPVVLSERKNGRVKWFNNKTGYGFITITDGDQSGSDMFAHHTAINVSGQQYKYLVQGEYVSFDLANTQTGKHEWQAVNVTGIDNGKLMCETRHEYNLTRNSSCTGAVEEIIDDTPLQRHSSRRTNTTQRPRTRGGGPREGGNEWRLADKSPRKQKRNKEEVVDVTGSKGQV